MTDLIIVLILAVIVGGAAMYIVKAKKKGVKCIGCPSGATCGKCSCGSEGACGQNCSCHTDK